MTTQTRTSTIRTLLIILAAFLTYGLVAGLRASSGVFVAEIADLTGVSYGVISTIVMIRNLLYAFSSPFWGFLTLRKSYVFVLICGLVLSSLGFIGVIFVPTYAGMVIFQGIAFGIGAGAVCYSITYAAAARFLSQRTAAVFAGILSMAQGTFNVIMTPIVTASGATGTGFILCMIGISLAIAAIIPMAFFFRGRNRNADAVPVVADTGRLSIKDILKTLAKSPFFYLLSLSFFIYGLCQGQMMNHLLKRGTEIMGLDTEGATLLVMIYGFALVVGPFLGGIIVSRVTNKRLALAIMFMGWAAIVFISCGLERSIPVYIVTIVMLGIVISMAYPFHAVLAQERIPISYFGAMFSVIAMFEVFGYAVNAYFGGLCFDLTGSFFVFDVVVVGLALLIGIVYAVDGIRKRRRTSPE